MLCFIIFLLTLLNGLFAALNSSRSNHSNFLTSVLLPNGVYKPWLILGSSRLAIHFACNCIRLFRGCFRFAYYPFLRHTCLTTDVSTNWFKWERLPWSISIKWDRLSFAPAPHSAQARPVAGPLVHLLLNPGCILRTRQGGQCRHSTSNTYLICV